MPVEGTAAATAGSIGVETPVVETTPAAPSPAQDPQLAQKFGALAKREKTLVKRSQEISEREKALLEREKRVEVWESAYSKFKTDPREALREAGWDYSKLTEAQLNDFKPKPEEEIQSVRGEVQSLKQQLAERERLEKEAKIQAEKDAFTAQEKQARGQVKSEIESLAEKYEFINLFGEHDLVYDTMLEHFKQTGKIMSLDEAAQKVEDFLEKEEVEKITKAKKFQSKYAPQTAQDAGKGDDKNTPVITNRVASTPQGVVPAKTDAERIARALAALEKRS